VFRLARLSLRNRAVVLLATLAIVVAGAQSLLSLRTELIPSLEYPMAAVIGTYPGVAPSIVEQRVTRPLEAAIRSVPGVDELSSTSANSMSTAIVQFDFGTDMTWANQRLTTALARIAPMLPDGVDTQVITGSMDELPVLQLAISSGEATGPEALAQAVDSALVPRIEDLSGVAGVSVSGFSAQEITITPDAAALAARGVDPSAIVGLLTSYGLELPAGSVADGAKTLSVRAGSSLTSVDQIAALSLPTAGGAVPLAEVAAVTQAPAQPDSVSRMDGAPSVALSVTKTPAATAVEVSDDVREVIADQRQALEEQGLRVEVVFDQAPFITDSINALGTEGLLGLGFAVLVILAFLLSLSSTIVAAISIPLSLLATFLVMKATGETLNILTLGAMTIAIGRVVDDSIVVIENIKRHLSYGEEKRHAIVTAVREVGGAIAASTVCTIAVFAPIALVGGVVGELFRPFALTVAIALTASLLVALTIVPVLAYWFVRAPVTIDAQDRADQQAKAVAKEKRSVIQRLYLPTVRGALAHPVITLLLALAILGGTASQVPRMQANFLDAMGGNTVTVTQEFAPATSLDIQSSESRVVEDRLGAVEDVATIMTTVGGSGLMGLNLAGIPSASFSITLTDDADSEAAVDAIRAAVADAGGPSTTSITVSANGRNSSPTTPPTSAMGANTAMVQTVEAAIAPPTSRTAVTMAWRFFSP
jgi:HAE1 family hydrophobic/amphiphilic exporter-1